MAQENLEGKLEPGRAKELLKKWSVFAAMGEDANEKVTLGSGKNAQEVGVTYAQLALENWMGQAKSMEEMVDRRAVYIAAATDLKNNGVYTNSIKNALDSYKSGYNSVLAQTVASDVATIARELGYKGVLPEFLLNYRGTFAELVKENAEKAKVGDIRASAVLKAADLLQNVLVLKSRENLKDLIYEREFVAMDEAYKNPEKVKEAQEKAKKARATQAQGQVEQEE